MNQLDDRDAAESAAVFWGWIAHTMLGAFLLLLSHFLNEGPPFPWWALY